MVRLNVESVVELTGAVLPGMVQRRRGAILNVASIAGYLPGPGQAVYHASKAFVRAFSLALAEENRGTGVTVTTLSPGPWTRSSPRPQASALGPNAALPCYP